jgi:hypothetical protein
MGMKLDKSDAIEDTSTQILRIDETAAMALYMMKGLLKDWMKVELKYKEELYGNIRRDSSKLFFI